jgi:hypothetical protein
MPLINSDYSYNSVSTMRRTRPTPCPYIDNFLKYAKEKYEMDNRIFERGLARIEETERRHAEVRSWSRERLDIEMARMSGSSDKVSHIGLTLRRE